MREPGLSGRTFCLRLPLKEGFPIIHCNTCGRSQNLTGTIKAVLEVEGHLNLDFSTPSFHPGPFNPRLFNHELFIPGLFNPEFLNHRVEKFMFVKSGVEKSGVEMSSL